MYVVPKAGLSIRDPDLRDLLPASGRNVPESDYWYRRLRDGDVIAAADPVAVAAAAAESKGGK